MSSKEPEDFASMLEQFGGLDRQKRLSVGEKVSAKVIHLTKENVFFTISQTQEAFMPRVALGEREVKVGDTLEAMVVSTHEGVELGLKLGRDRASIDMLEQARATQLPVEGVVTGVNKGGLEVSVGNTRAFCPLGQIDLSFVEDPSKLVGKTLQFVVREVRENGRSVVLSRRALMESERRTKADSLRKTLAVGQRLQGKVSRIQDFGIFVDLGGLDGMIPMSELSHTRIADPRSVVKEGDEITVDVIRIEDDPKRKGEQRIGLSLKATQADPFDAFVATAKVGITLEGKVAKLENFGAFVEVAPGVQGLVHVSELSHKRVRQPSDVVSAGDTVAVRLLGIDVAKRRIALSIKEAGAQPDPASTGAGSIAEVTVDLIDGPFVHVKLENGAAAVMHASETGAPRDADLKRLFPQGTKLAVRVMGKDERGRVRVSKKAYDTAEERALVDAYQSTSSSGAKGFGTLGDLLKKK